MKLITKIISSLSLLSTAIIAPAVTVSCSCGSNKPVLQLGSESDKRISIAKTTFSLNQEIRAKYTTIPGFDVDIDHSSIQIEDISMSFKVGGCYCNNGYVVIPASLVTSKTIIITLDIYNKEVVSFRNIGPSAGRVDLLLKNLSPASDVDLWYSSTGEDESWTKIEQSTKYFDLPAGSELYFKGNNPDGLSISEDNCVNFQAAEGNLTLEGNIMGLIDNGLGKVIEVPSSYCFANLLALSDSLYTVSFDLLPATILTEGCYDSMFYNCKNLANTPYLAPTQLADSCFMYMFQNCDKLTYTDFVLPDNLTPYCCLNMFESCDNLKFIPVLPTSKLTTQCYKEMFANCINLNISQDSGKKVIFDLLSHSQIAGADVMSMFTNTGGLFKESPIAGHTYYLN